MRYLVTGTGGFVMSVLIERLLHHDPDATVTGVDLHSSDAKLEGYFHAVRNRLRLTSLDVRDAEGMCELVRSTAPDVIVHGATVTHDPKSERENPGKFLDVNVLGTANLLDAARDAPPLRRCILISSGAVYGDNPQEILTERSTSSPDEMYGISKWAAERAALRYSDLYDLPLAIVRLTKMFGPMERPTLGRQAMSLPYHLAAAFIEGKKLAVTERTLRASGDWLNATEAAEALRIMAKQHRHGNRIYNLASGVRTTVPELAALFGEDLLKVTEPTDAEYDMEPAYNHGKNGVLARECIAEELGWSCGPLTTQVSSYIEWVRNNRELFTGS
ncbi:MULTISPECIES: NAD(P)-dependent oxidoreductase [Actinopolyspora]|uniref:NAD-dependent epimerase/dehydratase family protein n=1 Tax=Actinopolyspora TaxID=1849 RepID=UPI000365433B|nr:MULTISPECIES: NAD(P)-dependent oxidoreductase [Actinopolyspora]NHD17751.1 NAD(P)-dependent oxidoreductase [Actinopolyspora sp. BKK2]NHE76516.1 NAD(P)-dependent oxidoreductase [Actinopolyspora sp. BKK1]